MTITKTRRNILLCAITALSAVACAPAEEDVSPASDSEIAEQSHELATYAGDPNQVTIGDVSASGSGCPSGSWTKSLSSDGLALTLVFSKYFLQASPSKPIVQSIACNIKLRLDMPRGYSVGVTKVSYSGYASLQKGVVAEQIANYAWTGVGTLEGKEAKSTLSGPVDKEYLFVDDVTTRGAGIQWSPCDIRANLQIRSNLVLNNPNRASGYINTSAIDVSQKTKLVINFGKKSC